jgi:hypothetical protein
MVDFLVVEMVQPELLGKRSFFRKGFRLMLQGPLPPFGRGYRSTLIESQKETDVSQRWFRRAGVQLSSLITKVRGSHA